MNTEQIYTLLQEKNLSISIDTRTIKNDSVYIGIKGDTFDGNSFAEQAFANGAQYVILDNAAYCNNENCILVPDTKKFLSEIAYLYRKSFSIPVICIGGSNGKTTTKELVAQVLQTQYNIHVTKGNLNNDIGVPLTILAMPKDTEIAVIEIGANHPLEHTELLHIIEPTHILVTNNGADHLEGFGSIEGARYANKEIYDWAQHNPCTVFVNKNITDLVTDSEHTNRILYPILEVHSNSKLFAGLIYNNTSIQSTLFGSYNEPNILAAIAIGEFFSISLENIKNAIENYIPNLKRSQIVHQDTTTFAIDCYNANPTSMELALIDFFTQSPQGKRIIIIGDMLEIGEQENMMHKHILDIVQKYTIAGDTILCVGPRFFIHKNEFPYIFFETSQHAQEYFDQLDIENNYVFLKASRGIKLETVIKNKVPLS